MAQSEEVFTQLPLETPLSPYSVRHGRSPSNGGVPLRSRPSLLHLPAHEDAPEDSGTPVLGVLCSIRPDGQAHLYGKHPHPHTQPHTTQGALIVTCCIVLPEDPIRPQGRRSVSLAVRDLQGRVHTRIGRVVPKNPTKTVTTVISGHNNVTRPCVNVVS